ncbi:MAG TPA: hypothetical protein VFQ73_07740 [Flavisolibacter sp.]|nr:hypothetical protein [Flavisolibacter sp.]
MKKIASYLFVLIVTLTGCLDTVEELTITADGSGTYNSTMDMSGMFEMIEMMAAMDTSASKQMKQLSDKDIDSTISMKSFTDTASDLTEEQKRLLSSAQMSITMKQKDKLFKMGMNYPFKNLQDVQKIIELNNSGKGVGAFGKGKDTETLPGMGDRGNMPSIGNFFDMVIKDGLIERKINDSKLQALNSDEKFKEMKNAGEMMGAVTFKSIIHLPRAATKIEGEKAKLSDDKKTVTISSALTDLFENPSSLNFRIEY